ncbi:MAG: hypothetical protein V1777_04775 [Candidatus Micrarchaeota archaeon]
MRKFFSRAQISVEMLIIAAALVGLVLFLVSQLTATGTKASAKIGEKSDQLMAKIDELH